MPPRVGLNWLIYILPPAIIMAGGVLLITLIRKGKTQSDQIPVETPSHDSKNLEDYLAIIDQDLKDKENNG